MDFITKPVESGEVVARVNTHMSIQRLLRRPLEASARPHTGQVHRRTSRPAATWSMGGGPRANPPPIPVSRRRRFRSRPGILAFPRGLQHQSATGPSFGPARSSPTASASSATSPEGAWVSSTRRRISSCTSAWHSRRSCRGPARTSDPSSCSSARCTWPDRSPIPTSAGFSMCFATGRRPQPAPKGKPPRSSSWPWSSCTARPWPTGSDERGVCPPPRPFCSCGRWRPAFPPRIESESCTATSRPHNVMLVEQPRPTKTSAWSSRISAWPSAARRTTDQFPPSP